MAIRQTWGKSTRLNYRFLLDNTTPTLIEEQKTYTDILFLNSTFSDKAKGFGEKLDLWLRYAYRNFPNALLISKVDDDVYICDDFFYKKLQEDYHPRY